MVRTRRQLLEDAMFAAAAAAAAGVTGACAGRAAAPAAARHRGPSDKLRVAVVGVNSRGMAHVRGFAKQPGVEVVAVCDLDDTAAGKAIESAIKQAPSVKPPRHERDLRRLLDDKEIDIVSIAMPNHWHALAAGWAIQAGKDVYLEKPGSHNLREGRAVVDLARKHGRMVQIGSQSRSNPGMRQFIGAVQGGRIGKVSLARGLCYKRRESIGRVAGALPPPPGIDYDLWLGPASARKDVPRERFHYDWHWQWEYGNGDIGNQGAHEIDKARWGLGKKGLPHAVISVGGRLGYQDDGQTPNTQIAFYDYGDAHLVFEVRGLPSSDLLGAKVGNIFYGTEGYGVSTNYSSGTLFDLKGKKVEHFSGGADHFANFLSAVRSRRHEELNCDVDEGRLSAALCHLGNISYRLGSPQPLGSRPSTLAPFRDAEDSFVRLEKHLVDAGLPAQQTQVQLGRALTFDPVKESFGVKEIAANALLSREYRAGFVMPTGA